MSHVFANIRCALDPHLDVMVGRPSAGWDNKKITPKSSAVYLGTVNMQGDTVAVTSLQDETVGVYEIEIFAPANEGKEEITKMADTVADRFKQDSSLTYLLQEVRVRNVKRGASRPSVDGWVTLSVDVIYYAFSDKR